MNDEEKTKKQLINELKVLREELTMFRTFSSENIQIAGVLRDFKEIYENFYKSNPHPMWIYDLETLAFLDVNDAAIKHYGYSQEEFLFMTIKDIRPPEDIPALLENITKVTKGLDIAGTWRHIKKDGTLISVEIISHTLNFRGRRAEIVMASDITERKRAEESLRKSEKQLRNLTAYIQKVAEVERMNIAREIHDDLGQVLTVLKMDVFRLKKSIPEDQESLIKKTEPLLHTIDNAIQRVKKISSNLRPGILDDIGLSAAIEWQAEEFQEQTGIKCHLAISPKDILLDRDRNIAIFRIFQETLTNIARHAEATEASIRLQEGDGHIEIDIQDNGKGITEEELTNPKSLGLMGMRERAKIFGGDFIIKGVPGKGTKVTVTMPIHTKEEL
jgi:PAS domain S-box-containing protein